MRLIAKKIVMALLIATMLFTVTACNPSEYTDAESQIISAGEFAKILKSGDDFQVIDMRKADEYGKGHVDGAVNLQRSDIMISVPVDNMLTSRSKFETLMRENGIKDNVTLYIYDNDRMNAARLWWSFLVYGNENARVIDGGFDAIQVADIELTKTVPTLAESSYTAKAKNTDYVATMNDVKGQLNEPNPNLILLDVRTDQEYIDNGKVPSSIMMDYVNVFYADNTFKRVQTIRIDFLEKGMRPENEIIMYCQTSMRAAPVFLSLYNAGYRNIRIYDGAFLEWSSNPNNPIDKLEGTDVLPNIKDAS